MLEVGTVVKHKGETYVITNSKRTSKGRTAYILKSLTNGSKHAAFEEDVCEIKDYEYLKPVAQIENSTSQLIQPEYNAQNMKLACYPLINGIMAYWEKIEEAAYYIISLYINEQIISTRINERSELYITFTGLAAIDGTTKGLFKSLENEVASAAHSNVVVVGGGGGYSRPQPTYSGMDYYVQVQAENRNGEVIASSNKIKCRVREF